MSSSSIISSLAFIGQQIHIYVGTFIVIGGTVGGLLNTIVFLSLHTFRQSPCAVHLTVLSIANIGQLFTGMLSRVMSNGFGIDWTQSSMFYCKFRLFMLHICTLLTCACMCLAIIDQYLVTCFRPRWQQWSNIKLAYRLIIAFSIIWFLHGIPYLIYFNRIQSPSTGNIVCIITNAVFQQYLIYFVVPILAGFLPIIITVVFGIMAYHNVQHLTHRTLPLVRRELDKQLTVMVLVQTVSNCICCLPFTIMNALNLTPNLTNDPIALAYIQFINTVTAHIYYFNIAVSLY